MPVNNISLMAPTDYTAEAEAIARKRKLAEALQAQSMQPIERFSSGGIEAPISWTQGLAKILQGYAANQGQERATAEQKALGKKYQTDLSSTLAEALRAGQGSPARAAQLDPQESEQMADQGTAAPPNIAAEAPDRARMAAILMQHPATQGIGIQQMSADMQRQALVSALQGGQGGPQGAPNAGTPQGQPGMPQNGQNPAVGGPAGGVPMAAWIQADPTGKAYMEQLAKDNAEANKPVISRGYGVGRMVNGQYVPDPASLGQIRDVETVKKQVAQPYGMQQMEVPVWIPGGDQTTVKLNPMQAEVYNRTGKLPPEIAASIPGLNQGQPAPQGAPNPMAGRPPAEQAALRQVMDAEARGQPANVPVQGGMGTLPASAVVGRTQTQNEQVMQSGQTAEAKKTGEQLGDYSTTVMNDAAKAAVSNRYLDNMELAAKDISLGKLAPAQSALVQWAQAAGLPVPAEARKAAGSTQALASMAIKMAGQATRQSDAQPSQLQYFKMLESMPDIGRSPEGFSRIVAYLRDANNYNVAKMQHLQQWRQEHNGTAAGFEAQWPQIADKLPFVWNAVGKTPQATLRGSNPSIDDLVNHYVKSR